MASAAYRSGTEIFCEYDNSLKDFTRKEHVVYSEILLPENAPSEFSDRSTLWNAVENFETRANSQLARQVEFSLPRELPQPERIKLAREMADYFRCEGMIVDMNIHEPKSAEDNPHCHLMLTMRPLDSEGNFVKNKYKREYILDENGNKIPRVNKNAGKVDYKFKKVSVTNWDDRDRVEVWRQEWCRIQNDYFKSHGLELFAEHRSYERQGLPIIPTIHLGPAASAMEKKGIRTRLGDINREIKVYNEQIVSIHNEMKKIEWQLSELQKQYEILDSQPKEEGLIKILMSWQNNRTQFIQDNGIRQRQSSKVRNIKDLSQMVLFIEQKNLRTVEDLQSELSRLETARRDAIHESNACIQRMRDLGQAIDNYEYGYKVCAKTVKEYLSLSGKDQRKFLDKHPEIEQALIYRTGMLNKTGSKVVEPKKWKSEYEELKRKNVVAKKALSRIDEDIATVSDILTKITQVEKAKVVEREQPIHTHKRNKETVL